MRLITRTSKGSKLTIAEMDGNLEYLQALTGMLVNTVYNNSNDVITGLTVTSGLSTPQPLELEVDANKTAYIVKPDLSITVSVDGVISDTWDGAAGDIALIVPKDSTYKDLGKYQPKNDSAESYRGKKANFLGDSITVGLYWNGTGWSTMPNPYPVFLKNFLGLSVARNYGQTGSHISGNSVGNESDNFCVRYLAMDDDADLIFVYGGTNDFIHDVTSPFGTSADTTDISFCGGVNVLMDGLKVKYPNKEIIFMTTLHIGTEAAPNPVTGKYLYEYNDVIKAAGIVKGIKVIDMYSYSDLDIRDPSIDALYFGDAPVLVHPNPAGSEYLACELYSYFKV